MAQIINDWLVSQGLGESLAYNSAYLILALVVVLLAWVANIFAKKILLSIVSFLIKKSKTEWDDYFLKRKMFLRLSHIAPALVLYLTADLFGDAELVLRKVSMIYMYLAGLGTLFSFLNAVADIYNRFDVSRQRPIKGYVQVVKIILTVVVSIVVISMMINKNPLYLLSGLGAMTAVLLLVFKDSILGFVASIQISTNDMVRVGDWIEMPKFGADGDVIDISLNTIKVQNWDKTITTIPTYAMISDSFKNWRGMDDSGGRRIKRAINIDMNSIKFVDDKLLSELNKIDDLKEYISNKQQELSKYNSEHQVDGSIVVNGRRMTNIGTFRAYLEVYLNNHPKIHKDMTFLIRQLPSNEKGLPIEIYVFSNDQDWVRYEGIQSDIFDHILAVLPSFDLRVYQYPSGVDLAGHHSS